MDTAKNCNTQIVLPNDLYQVIKQQAKVHGCSVNSEIVSLLAASLGMKVNKDLAEEFLIWEMASDEDWLNIEERLAREAY